MSTQPPGDQAELIERVTALEVRVAYQEHLLGQLDDVVREFSRRVEAVERRLRELADSAGQGDIGAADEPPPHY